MKTYDIGIGWVDPVESAFVHELKKQARKKGYSLYEMTYESLADDFAKIQNQKLGFKLFLDRGSIDNAVFLLISYLLQRNGTRVINNPLAIARFSSKAALLKIIKKERIPLPKVVLLKRNSNSRTYYENIAKKLGTPFVIKPAYGGAIDDVLLTAETGKDILDFIEDNFADDYLAQEYVVPKTIQGKTAWFRPLYVCGTIIPLWWDPLNHFYQTFGKSRAEMDIMVTLSGYMEKIARGTNLSLFSSEFAIRENGRMVIIDYANQPIDMNTSQYANGGLPKSVVTNIVKILINQS